MAEVYDDQIAINVLYVISSFYLSLCYFPLLL
jgi:hypothetical protein